jgi:cytoskeletal protein RodZ
MKNQKGFGIVEWFLLVAVVLIVGGVGYFIYNSNIKNKSVGNSSNVNSIGANKESASQTTQSEQASASASKTNTSASTSKQTAVKVIEPVSSAEFSSFASITAGQPIYPSEPSKVGDKVSANSYQGIVITDGTSTRILFGKLSDKSLGVLQLSDAFEYANKTLSLAKPNLISINTTFVVKWANLPNDNKGVQAILQWKAQNP